ncbi:SCL-interrupting locus protein homolog isoform X2 [Acanthochromis polyacanthus]|uniref:SCL-interrupting locus protein homolog isoform X2 n=1 Tax=Acanthochromis polyacanthus TaxID=80966 RepID=UPI00223434E2|nr:SCL-interrupting locus protein homolog isoform X2 [Acanthochromis polyacanthus]
MSCPVNLQAMPCGVFEKVLTPENVRGRASVNSLTQLSFPKSRSALWDSSPTGEKLQLQLCSHRKPRLVLLEKALRLAQRHARHSNKPRLHCFFLGSVSVSSDEEGITVTLDRFDPGRDQAGASGRVPSALLPGDVLVPCLFSTQTEMMPDAVVQSEAELHHCFKVLQHFVSSRQTLDLCHLLKVRGCVVCSQQSDAAVFSLSWSVVCPSVGVDVEPVRVIPIIPTALLRSLTSISQPRAVSRQRGFLTMDQTRKLLLLLESDPKAFSLPLVGIWLSGVTHIYNPEVWAWCLRFMFSLSLQDRVLSESSSFLLVLFSSTHRAPQFYQCRASRPGPQLDCQLLTASQSYSYYQVALVDGQSLQCELSSEVNSRQMEAFREAQSTFTSISTPIAGRSISDQDSGVEDEDLSPRPSPSPHPPAQQTRRVQPSVPELSLLIDGSFTSSHNAGQDSGYVRRSSSASRTSASPSEPTTASSSAPRPTHHPPAPLHPPPHLHSTPNSNLQQPCTCCSNHTYDCTTISSSPGLLPAAAPPASHQSTTSPSSHPATPSAPPGSAHQPVVPPVSLHTPPPALHHTSPPSSSTHRHTPPPPSPSPFCPCSHPPPPLWCADSLTPHPSCLAGANPVSPPWLPRPSYVNQCSDQMGGVGMSDTYQLLLHQDHQLRLLQAQVQMLLEAQGKLQSSSRQADTQTPRSTASIAVGTGASLFWGDPVQPLSQEEVQASPHSSPSPLSSPKRPSSTTSSPSVSSHGLSANRPVGGADDSDIRGQTAAFPSFGKHSISGVQSPVLGESVSMYRPAEEQQSFYHNLMTQLTSRLQESDSKEEEEVESQRTSVSVVYDPPQYSQPSESSLSTRRKQQQTPVGDPVVSATLRQLQQLGVDVDKENLTEFDKNRLKAVENASTLASINPAAVLSRLSMPEQSTLFPGGSVDLSLEANAIALRYLSDSQLSRLSLGGHIPQCGSTSSSNDYLLSPSNMSLATRKYMRKYGLIEEEEGHEDEEEEDEHREIRVQEPSDCHPLAEALNVKVLPQSQLIRDLRPKMQLLAGSTKPNMSGKENMHPYVVRTSSHHTEGSVGNILDLSRLRQLPKLF